MKKKCIVVKVFVILYLPCFMIMCTTCQYQHFYEPWIFLFSTRDRVLDLAAYKAWGSITIPLVYLHFAFNICSDKTFGRKPVSPLLSLNILCLETLTGVSATASYMRYLPTCLCFSSPHTIAFLKSTYYSICEACTLCSIWNPYAMLYMKPTL